MIRSEKGGTRLSGPIFEIMADLSCIIKSVREMLIDEFGEDEAEIRLEDVFTRSKLSDAELKKSGQRQIGSASSRSA